MKKVGVVLLSGGLDSTVLSTYAKSLGYEITALTFSYGQRLSREIFSAKKVAEVLGIKHKIIDVAFFKDLAWYSALTSSEKFSVPKGREIVEAEKNIPSTYVPLRNTFFIVIGAAFLESEVLKLIEEDGVRPSEIEAKIFIAANAVDYSGYPDCRPEYFNKMNVLLNSASKVSVEYNVSLGVEAPFLYYSKKDIVELGMRLKAPLEWSWSCYEGGEIPCGECDSCRFRQKGFDEAGFKDPLLERLRREGKAVGK